LITVEIEQDIGQNGSAKAKLPKRKAEMLKKAPRDNGLKDQKGKRSEARGQRSQKAEIGTRHFTGANGGNGEVRRNAESEIKNRAPFAKEVGWRNPLKKR